MTMLTEISNVLGIDLLATEPDFGSCIVDDLYEMQPAPKTILLVESPDVKELSAGHPLAGKSGEGVTAALKRNESIRPILEPIESANEDDEAIGSILQRCAGTLRLGLMNASRFPLDIGAYADRDSPTSTKWYRWQRLHSEFLCLTLQAVKNRHELLSYEAEDHASRIYRVLLDDFKSRLEGLSADVLVVPCGKVAQTFVKDASGMEGYSGEAGICECDVPHPARGQWSRKKHAQVVTWLVNMIYERSRADA